MPKTRGRPLLGDEPKRHSVSFRITPALKRRLDEALSESGRSLAQELEHRLERSFRDDDLVEVAKRIVTPHPLRGLPKPPYRQGATDMGAGVLDCSLTFILAPHDA